MAALDPKLVLLQIVALQCFYYVIMGLLLAIFRVIFGTQVTKGTSAFLDECACSLSKVQYHSYQCRLLQSDGCTRRAARRQHHRASGWSQLILNNNGPLA